ncbi:MAG TPA: heavy metal translocating P-type ATPase, partial [Bacteroidales bacterium]|nr:heavy metal translocating P-type ATPase [Bacteroidales bacterium]
VPVVVVIAVITFVVWVIFGPEPALLHAFVTAVSVLVIACPCALGLATPAAIVAGVGRGANLGILLRDIDSLEKASKITTIVLDKTGTLTIGKPVVTNVWLNPHYDPDTIKTALFSLESMSDHPVAQAIVNYCEEKGVSLISAREITNLPGEGITGIIDGKRYYAGNKNLIEKLRIQITDDLNLMINEWLTMSRSLVWFSSDKELLAIIGINDPLKADAPHAIKALSKKGIELMLLSGDGEAPVKSVASQLGISSYIANVLPHEKHIVVEQLQKSGKVVAFAGDGINDAAALAQADVGISMASGSDIAIESAGITLMNNNPLSIADAISLSRKTIRIVRQNLFWAFIYNILAIPISAGVMFPIAGFLLDPMIAGVAMVISSVTVVTNSMRLRWYKPELINRKSVRAELLIP